MTKKNTQAPKPSPRQMAESGKYNNQTSQKVQGSNNIIQGDKNNYFLKPFNLIKGIIAGTLITLNLFILPSIVLISACFMFINPIKKLKKYFTWFQQVYLPPYWADINNLILKFMTPIEWEIKGKGELNIQDWYFLICNHQSWADILVLDKIFNRKIPKIKFFMKKELIWMVPICGLACFVMGYPFIKRHRDRKGLMQDIETAKKISQSFKDKPTTIANFLEGTRFTPEKYALEKNSPYKHLLPPNPLMLAVVTEALTGYMNHIINVTIIYSKKPASIWSLLSGEIKKITVHYEVLPIDNDLCGDYLNDKNFRKRSQERIKQIWLAKDQLIK